MTATRVAAITEASLAEAAQILRAGGLVAFPTETVYGLGADATSDDAVTRIYEAKERPRFNPLIVHVADRAMAERHVRFDERAIALAEQFWPGPLTLVLPRRPDSPLSLLVSAGLDSVAIRVPGSAAARRLIALAGRPIAAPSANASGRVSPTTAQHVLAELGGRVPLILAGGRAEIGLESSVLDLTGETPRLLRPGGVTREAIEAIIGPVAAPEACGPLASPGMLRSHYAPARPVRLHAAAAEPGEAFLAFGPTLKGHQPQLNLSETGSLHEAAANLFAMLRALDVKDVRAIAVAPIPEEGLGEAINDRLRRAAAPRDTA